MTFAFFAGVAFFGAEFDLVLTPPKKEKAGAAFFGSGGIVFSGSTLAGFDPPKRESVARAGLGLDFTGSNLGSSFAGFDLAQKLQHLLYARVLRLDLLSKLVQEASID